MTVIALTNGAAEILWVLNLLLLKLMPRGPATKVLEDLI
jgi:hypothetical protein